MNFVTSLGELLKPIIDEINFTPRFVTYGSEQNTKEFKEENCLSNGKYCATHHGDSDSYYNMFRKKGGEVNGR